MISVIKGAQPLILSIHIPKTAGQTLLQLLELAYGKEQVLHLNRGFAEAKAAKH